MSTLTIIGIAAIALVLLVGIGIKLSLRQRLREIDGLDSHIITQEGSNEVYLNERLS